MSPLFSDHVSSDRLGEAAQHASLDGLRDLERRHVESCERCKRLYAGYRLTDRMLASTWRQTVLPAGAIEAKPIRTGITGALGGVGWSFGRQTLVPVAIVASLVLAVGFGVMLPQLVPSASPSASPDPALASQGSPVAVASPTFDHAVEPSESAATGPSAGPANTSGGIGPVGPGTATPRPTPAPPATPQSRQAGTPAALPGWPIAWSPDGSQLLVARGGFGGAGQIQIRSAAGGLTASLTADGSAWFNAHTVAIAAHGPGRSGGESVSLVDLKGQVVATLPAGGAGGPPASTGALLVGSGTGYVAVTSGGAFGSSQSFALWDGQTSSVSHQGVPLAFSRDGGKLAVLHPFGGFGGGFGSGTLEIVAVPSLTTIGSFPHTTLRVSAGGSGPAYAPDVDFSPDGNWLTAAGTLVDLSRGTTVQVGDGGWLPNGNLITSSGGIVLRWQGVHSTPDSHFVAGGSIETSLHGDVIEFFGDGRPLLMLAADGSFGPLQVPGIASLDALLLSPDGGAMAFEGRGANGSRVTAVARLK